MNNRNLNEILKRAQNAPGIGPVPPPLERVVEARPDGYHPNVVGDYLAMRRNLLKGQPELADKPEHLDNLAATLTCGLLAAEEW